MIICNMQSPGSDWRWRCWAFISFITIRAGDGPSEICAAGKAERMEFISTRGGKSASFEEVLLGGLAPDGGLYLPRQWPAFGADEIRDFASLGYAEAAVRVLSPLTTDTFSADELRTDASSAYASFSHGAVAPLVQLEPDVFLL